MLRSVTLCKNDSLFQSGVILSRRIRFPAFVARGRISIAGLLKSSLAHESHVLPRIPIIATTKVKTASQGLNKYSIGAKSYKELYAYQKISGKPQVPRKKPITQPSSVAKPAYNKYFLVVCELL